MSEPASVEEGLGAISALGVLILVNHQLVSNLSPYKMIDSAIKAPRKWAERIVWFIFWVPNNFLGFWIGIWGIAVLSALCTNVIVSSQLIRPLVPGSSLGIIFAGGFCASVSCLIGLEHLKKLQTAFGEMGLATRKGDIPILYLCSLTALLIEISAFTIMGFITMSLIVSLLYWSKAAS